MKVEELNNYIKEQYEEQVEKYNKGLQEYNKGLQEYNKALEEYNKALEEKNKINDEYLKEKDKIVDQYDAKIDSIKEARNNEIEIARKKIMALYNESLLEIYKHRTTIETGTITTEYIDKDLYFSKFLGRTTQLLTTYEHSKSRRENETTYRLNSSDYEKNLIQITDNYFFQNADFFKGLKSLDKSFVNYKILEQIQSVLMHRYSEITIQSHEYSQEQNIQELERKYDFLYKKFVELDKKLAKRFTLAKRRIRKQLKEISEEISSTIKSIKSCKEKESIEEGITECEAYIEEYKQGKTQELNFKSEELKRLFNLMKDSIEEFISKGESVKQKEEEISVLKENKNRDLTDLEENRNLAVSDLPLNEPNKPISPEPVSLSNIYLSEWAKDEELVKEIKTLKEENLEPYVKEILNMIIKENRKLYIEGQEAKYRGL